MADHRLKIIFAAGAATAALAVSAAAQDRGYGPGYEQGYPPQGAQDRGDDRTYGPPDAPDRGYDRDDDRGAAPRSGQDRGYDRGYEPRSGYDRGHGRGYEGDDGRDDGRDRAPAYADRLEGSGVYLLAPELRDTARGRAFVMRRFDFNRDGLVERDEARAANRAFHDGELPDRERFERRDREEPAPPPPPSQGAMRDYHFRQDRDGATFTLQDVLFETGSARLRPQADAKLRPIAGYLRAHASQQLRVDGYTDSVGSAQANLLLSRDRARAVADALTALGVDGARLHLEGHGEDSPIASNLDAQGRQQNRRVEVTLLGARAASFD